MASWLIEATPMPIPSRPLATNFGILMEPILESPTAADAWISNLRSSMTPGNYSGPNERVRIFAPRLPQRAVAELYGPKFSVELRLGPPIFQQLVNA